MLVVGVRKNWLDFRSMVVLGALLVGMLWYVVKVLRVVEIVVRDR